MRRPPAPRLEVEGLEVSIGGHRLIDDLGLRVGAGEVVGVVGPNGSGKTTLLRAIYRSLKPERGAVGCDELDLLSLTPREVARRLAALPQESPSDFDFTVEEIVMMGRTPHLGRLGREGEADRAIVAEALACVGLSEFAARSFPTLSGGERQRVLLARALAQQTGLLVLDEPTNHLDISHQIELLALVRSLGLTILVTLHDLNLASAWCDRLVVMSAGAVVAHGRPAQVLTPELLWRVFRVRALALEHPVGGAHQLLFLAPGLDGPPESHAHEEDERILSDASHS